MGGRRGPPRRLRRTVRAESGGTAPFTGANEGSLKSSPRLADPPGMATEATCPICSADLPLAGDEKKGDEVFCTVCGAPLKLRGDYGDERLDAEEDF